MMHTSYSRLLLLAVLLITPLASKAQETWSSRASGVTAGLWSVAYGNGQWIAVGESGTILSSVDGTTWSSRVSGYTSRWLVSVGYGASTWVVVGESGLILTSSDGSSWTARTSGTTSRINGVTYGGGRWIAVAESGELLTSTDSRTWTKLSPSTDRLRGITYSYGQFVITGDNGLIRTTIDSTDYSSNLLPSGFFVESVIYGRKTFVAVGEDGYVISSPDAVTWTNVKSGATSYLRGVTFFNGQFVAVGTSGVVLTAPSPDSAWTARQTGSAATLTAVAASDATIVAVGLGGAILQSTPPAAAPTINTAPAAIGEAAGSNVMFNVVATGSPPLSYQWSFNGAAIAGENSDTLFLANVSTAQAGNYSVTVKNSLGAVTSGNATLQLKPNVFESIIDSTFEPISVPSGVSAIAEQPDGQIIAAISQSSGYITQTLQRFSKNGVKDTSYSPAITGTVTQLVMQPDGKLLVLGKSSPSNSTYIFQLIRLNADGTLDQNFNAIPSTSESIAEICLLKSGSVLLRQNKINRIKSNGDSDASFIPIAITAVTFAADDSGKIYAADSGSLNRYNADGSIDSSFKKLIPSSGSIYYSYNFSKIIISSIGRVLYEERNYTYGNYGAQYFSLDSNASKSSALPSIGASGGRGSGLSTQISSDNAGNFYILYNTSLGIGNYSSKLLRYDSSFNLDLTFDANSEALGLSGGKFYVSSIGNVYIIAYSNNSGSGSIKIYRFKKSNALAPLKISLASISPETASVKPSDSLSLSVKAAGTGPITYEWKSSVPLVNADKETATFPTLTSGTYTVTVTATNKAGSVTSAPIRIVIAESSPVIYIQPTSISSSLGRSATFAATAAGSGTINYQWYRGTTLVGTGATLTLKNMTASDAGNYTLVATNSLGTTRSSTVQLSLDGFTRLANISTRAKAGPADNTLIAGFVISGATSKSVLIRGIAQGLAPFGLTGLLPEAQLTLFDASGKALKTLVGLEVPNGVVAGTGAFPLGTSGSDSAFVATLAAGNYTVQLSDRQARTGVALIEVYEADDNSNRISNLSSRAYVGAGASIAIGGISVQGDKPRQFLIRGVGPTLKDFGVSTALLDPVLKLTTALGAPVAENDDWSTSTNKAAIIAATAKLTFPFTEGSLDAAILITLSAGNYTALISGKNDTTGVALVEVYEIP
jgi:hypothetical protein